MLGSQQGETYGYRRDEREAETTTTTTEEEEQQHLSDQESLAVPLTGGKNERFLRHVLLSLHIFLLVTGLTIAIVGIYGAVRSTKLDHSLHIMSRFGTHAICASLSLIGTATVILSSFAIARFWKTHTTLFVYGIAMIISCGVLIALGSLLFLLTAPRHIDTQLQSEWLRDSPQDLHMRELRQRELKCCGYNTLTDTPTTPCPGFSIPCKQALQKLFLHNFRPIGIVTILLGIGQVIFFHSTDNKQLLFCFFLVVVISSCSLCAYLQTREENRMMKERVEAEKEAEGEAEKWGIGQSMARFRILHVMTILI